MAITSSPVEGIVGGYKGNSFAIQGTLIAFLSCAMFSALEVLVIALTTFKVYGGLYFWSIIVTSSLGIVPDAIGLLLKYFELAPIGVSATLSTFGWFVMVTGQSLVLYSRLNLVVGSERVVRFVLYMIIIDAVILATPQIVVTYGAIYSDNPRFVQVFKIWENLQLTAFFVQEVIISSIFIVETVRILRLYPTRSKRRTNIMYQLLCINVIIIMMDVSLLVLEYQNLFILQTALKTFFYSVKLKLEIAVLSKLVSLVDFHASDALTSEINP